MKIPPAIRPKIALAAGFLLLVGLWLAYFYIYLPSRWRTANDYYRAANYTKAAAVIRRLPMPSDPHELNVYAQTMFSVSEMDKAKQAYQKHYDKTGDVQSLLMVGNVQQQQKKFEEAQATYRKVIAKNPTYIQAYANGAASYMLANKRPEALKMLTEGVAANPNATALYAMQVQLLRDEKESETYKQALEKLKLLDPQNSILRGD